MSTGEAALDYRLLMKVLVLCLVCNLLISLDRVSARAGFMLTVYNWKIFIYFFLSSVLHFLTCFLFSVSFKFVDYPF